MQSLHILHCKKFSNVWWNFEDYLQPDSRVQSFDFPTMFLQTTVYPQMVACRKTLSKKYQKLKGFEKKVDNKNETAKYGVIKDKKG